MSLVQPHFDYSNSVRGCCGKTLASKLQKLQNRAARILTYSNYDANADNLIKKRGGYHHSFVELESSDV